MPVGQFVNAPLNPTNKLTLSLAATGAVTGSFYNPEAKKTVLLKGAFMNPAQGGFGFILDTNEQNRLFSNWPDVLEGVN